MSSGCLMQRWSPELGCHTVFSLLRVLHRHSLSVYCYSNSIIAVFSYMLCLRQYLYASGSRSACWQRCGTVQTHAAVLELALSELLSSQRAFTADIKNLLQGKVARLGLIEPVLSQSKEARLNQSWSWAKSTSRQFSSLSEKTCCVQC